MKNRQMDDVLKSYHDYMDQNTFDPAIRSYKKVFLETHFQPEPFWGFHPLFLVSAALLLAVFFCFHAYVPPRLVYIYPQPLKKASSQIAVPVVSTENKKDSISNSELPVKVDRVNSQVGPTMVFQSNRNHIPITIVWVFTGG